MPSHADKAASKSRRPSTGTQSNGRRLRKGHIKAPIKIAKAIWKPREVMMQRTSDRGARRWLPTMGGLLAGIKRLCLLVAAGTFVAAGMQASGPAHAAAVKDYGKPGQPVHLVIGYQPYYTESWSGVIMRSKKYYEKYLPKGSTVDFQIGLQGAIIVNGMLAGKVDVGYMGDMPAIVAASHRNVRDLRIVSVLGLGFDQCNIFLARTNAPKFKSPVQAIKWLNGKRVAVPKGSCTDRFARAVFRDYHIKPAAYLNQSIQVITSGFRAKKLDAAVIWEPTASRIIQAHLARRIASGASVDEPDGGFMVMPEALIKQRPDVVKAWLEGELDAERYFANPKHAMAIAEMAKSQTTGFPLRALWASAFGKYPKSEGGVDTRITLAYGFTKRAHELISRASKFLVKIKSIPSMPASDAVLPHFTANILKAHNLSAPVGEVKAQPASAFKLASASTGK